MKKFILSMVSFLCVAVPAEQMVLDDFRQSPPRCEYSVMRKSGVTFRHQPEKEALTVTLPEGKGGWIYCKLPEPADLEKFPIVELVMRSSDKDVHQYNIYINKQNSGKPPQSFYSVVETAPEKWNVFRLDTRYQAPDYRTSRLGRFRASGKQQDRTLLKGGKLHQLILAAAGIPASFEIRSIRLLSADNATAPKDWSGIVKPESAKFKPYTFSRINPERKLSVAANGTSKYAIRIAPKAGAAERFAAAELQRYLKKATQAELPIVSEWNRPEAIDLQLNGSGGEGFSSTGKDGRIVISGDSGRGLLYGVYDFLEKACGIRFFAPFPEYEIVPQLKTLEIPEFSDRSQPVMNVREINYCGYYQTSLSRMHEVADWSVKNRINGQLSGLSSGYRCRKLSFDEIQKQLNDFYGKRGNVYRTMPIIGHNFHRLIPPKTYFKSNPEYFCWDQDKKEWTYEIAQLCVSNPEVIRLIADQARKWFAQYPLADYFPLIPEDGARRWCQCPECSKLDPPGGYAADRMADRQIRFANRLREEFNRRGMRDKVIRTLAYDSTRREPFREKPLPGIMITYCLYTDKTPDFMKEASEMSMTHEMVRWAQISQGNLMIHPYIYSNFSYQFQTDRTLVADYRFFHRLGILGSYQEYSAAWDFNDYQMYLATRVPWNPWFDEKEFKQDYFDRLYGAASAPMVKFHELCHDVFATPDAFARLGLQQVPRFSREQLDRMNALLAEAGRLSGGDSRIGRLLARKKQLADYAAAFSHTLDLCLKVQEKPLESNWTAAKQELKKLYALTARLYRNGELTAGFEHDKYQALLEKSVDSIYTRGKLKMELAEKYRIIAPLPLTGWKFKTDPKRQGGSRKWENLSDYSDWKNIGIGFWEKQGYPSYDGDAYYQLDFKLPESSTGKNLHLLFEGVDESAWVYVNGTLAGSRTGNPEDIWRNHFLIPLPENLKKNEKINLVVKVNDFVAAGGIYRPVSLVEALR